jgi:hypothetical protein
MNNVYTYGDIERAREGEGLSTTMYDVVCARYIIVEGMTR